MHENYSEASQEVNNAIMEIKKKYGLSRVDIMQILTMTSAAMAHHLGTDEDNLKEEDEE
jgi:hypothetical protein